MVCVSFTLTRRYIVYRKYRRDQIEVEELGEGPHAESHSKTSECCFYLFSSHCDSLVGISINSFSLNSVFLISDTLI